jgi:hypothetical protein
MLRRFVRFPVRCLPLLVVAAWLVWSVLPEQPLRQIPLDLPASWAQITPPDGGQWAVFVPEDGRTKVDKGFA